MNNEAMGDKEKAINDLWDNGGILDMTGEDISNKAYDLGWDACAKRAIDKEKLIEWINIQTTFDSNEKLEFIKDITERIVSGEFNLK